MTIGKAMSMMIMLLLFKNVQHDVLIHVSGKSVLNTLPDISIDA